jgi:hypothetical protein
VGHTLATTDRRVGMPWSANSSGLMELSPSARSVQLELLAADELFMAEPGRLEALHRNPTLTPQRATMP